MDQPPSPAPASSSRRIEGPNGVMIAPFKKRTLSIAAGSHYSEKRNNNYLNTDNLQNMDNDVVGSETKSKHARFPSIQPLSRNDQLMRASDMLSHVSRLSKVSNIIMASERGSKITTT